MFACLGPAFEMVMAALHPAISSAESRRNSEFAVIETSEEIVQEDAISPKEEIEIEAGNRSPSTPEIEVDSEDGREKKKPGFFSAIRDFFNAPNMKIIHGKHLMDVPNKKIFKIDTNDIYAYESPEDALNMIHKQRLKRMSEDKLEKKMDTTPVGGIMNWKRRSDECYGIVTSLYDKVKDGSGNVGDPVADCTAVIARPNNCILVLADGVNWGERSRLSARSAVYGVVTYLTRQGTLDVAESTRDVFRSILRSFETAQNIIMEEEATLTTLCVGVVVELPEKDKWGFCVVNVGDSLGFVYNANGGVREVTIGSHSLDDERDMRYSGGALGPADGYNPDLSNLTCSYTQLETGDLVFLTSDGVSDNFDPTVGRFRYVRKFSKQSPEILRREISRQRSGSDQTSRERMHARDKLDHMLEVNGLTPRERHQGMLSKMKMIIEHEEGPTGTELSAIGVCAKFMNFVVSNTADRRSVLEKESLTEEEMHQLTSKQRKERSIYIKGQLDSTPGKLDHASIVAFEVGHLEPKPLKRFISSSSEGGYTVVLHEDLDGYSSLTDSTEQKSKTHLSVNDESEEEPEAKYTAYVDQDERRGSQGILENQMTKAFAIIR